MEEARQDSALVPNPLGLALVLLKLGELSSAFVAIILAFAASRYMLMAVNALGIFIAIRMTVVLLYASISGQMLYPRRSILRAEHPAKFWYVAAVNTLVLILGLFLTQLPISE